MIADGALQMLIDVQIRAEIAEQEAAQLRLELREQAASHIQRRSILADWHRHLEPLFALLVRFRQMSGFELETYVSTNREDEADLDGEIASFRQRWGCDPMQPMPVPPVPHQVPPRNS
jgi:hypothetical protein